MAFKKDEGIPFKDFYREEKGNFDFEDWNQMTKEDCKREMENLIGCVNTAIHDRMLIEKRYEFFQHKVLAALGEEDKQQIIGPNHDSIEDRIILYIIDMVTAEKVRNLF